MSTLASHLIGNNDVKIIDLDIGNDPSKELLNTINDFHPDIVATSAKTPDYFSVRSLMKSVKECSSGIKTIVGGVHVTACPDEVAQESCFDIVVAGEADTVMPEILSSLPLEKIPGLILRQSGTGEKIFTGRRQFIENLDELPFPAWQLFDITKYKNSRISSRQNPVGHIETSRGCMAQCNFCSKLTFGSRLRVKTPRRVVDEMEYMLKIGFKEIHVADDSFTQDIERAKEVCREIIRRGLKFPWALISGVRVNMVDFEFLSLAKKAGCWQVGFGIETGDQEVLNRINKKITLEQTKSAVRLAKKAGLDTFGFFIFGLSGETEGSMKKTISLAKDLPLDIAKFDICIPYPGTAYFQELNTAGKIRSYDWSKYICHQTEEHLFEHPGVSWERLEFYYKKAFKEFYLRPSYFARRFARSLKMGDLISDIQYFFKSKW